MIPLSQGKPGGWLLSYLVKLLSETYFPLPPNSRTSDVPSGSISLSKVSVSKSNQPVPFNSDGACEETTHRSSPDMSV